MNGELAAVKAAAERRADEDCALGLRNLEARIPTGAECVVSGDATGKRLLHPELASMVGMAEHLRASIAAEQLRRSKERVA